MADRKNTKAVGSDTAGGGVVKQRTAKSGRQESGAPQQSPQTSNRPGRVHEHEPTVRKGYEDAQDPEPQGDGDPGPEEIGEDTSSPPR